MPSAWLSIFDCSTGMLAGGAQSPSQMHEFWPFELYGLDRGAPGCGQADDDFEPFIPHALFLPALLARTKQID
ncbi:MAG TPA: hypothetical protein VLK82_16980 [Candidatus Tectomicrobia bacterium]|nr:hypothetical protein [Candidatus Tectomicrobia bacterium]